MLQMKLNFLLIVILKDEEIVIYEIGGTVGDIESLPFLEAIRQIRNDRKISSALIHDDLCAIFKFSR